VKPKALRKFDQMARTHPDQGWMNTSGAVGNTALFAALGSKSPATYTTASTVSGTTGLVG